jgi:uncharacterized coiled-coil protein SlyX
MRTLIEENENARRVLELTITDRLPRVEQRLTEAKKLLFQRDREIASLTETAAKQSRALDESTQINTQQRDEIHRLNATLTTRAARNREPMGRDQRVDEEIALRAELEALRAKSRDQAALINRLQGSTANRSGAEAGAVSGIAAVGGAAASGNPGAELEAARLRSDLAEAEKALKSARSAAETGQAGHAAFEAEVRKLKTQNEDMKTEVAKLKAALKAYEEEDADTSAVKDSKIAMKARLSALEAQAAQYTATIQSLRAEVAAANEKLARQSSHYVEEMRRLGAGTMPATGPQRRDLQDARRKSLTERIAAPRKERTSGTAGKSAAAETSPKAPQEEKRVAGFMRALDGAAKDSPVGADAAAEASPSAADASRSSAGDSATKKTPGRRPGLIERLTGIDKPAASG